MPADPGAGWMSPRPDGVRVTVRVTPRAAHSGIAGVRGDGSRACLALRVNAPPTEGKANAELIRLVAGRLGVAKGDVSIVSGVSARHKVLHVAGAPERLLERLATLEQETRRAGGGDR